MATLLKVLNNLADIKSAGGFALRVRTQGLRSRGPPRGLRWVGKREVDWTDTADCDDCRFILAADHSVVMRSSSHAVHETAGRRRHARSGVEISAAVDPPTARDNDAEPIGRIGMRSAHVSRMPADKDIVEAAQGCPRSDDKCRRCPEETRAA